MHNTGAGASFGIHGHEALFYLSDPLGSTVVSVMPTAGIRNRYLHRPFGDATVQEGVDLRHRFTGGPRNPYGLYQLGARTYDPDAGRFLQPDPLVGDPGLSQAYNRYGYVYNNPLAWADPSGLRADAREAGRSNFWLTVTLGFGDGGNDERSRPLYPLPHRASVVALEQGGSAGTAPATARPPAVGQGRNLVAETLRTFQDDLLSALLGTVWGNVLGVARGFGDALAGSLTGDGRRALGGLGSAAQALVPRYGFTSGPDYGGDFEGLTPRHIIDLATLRHDRAYARLAEQGVPFLSPGRNSADLALIREVWGEHRLGPVGQIYRVGLTAAFGLKIGAQSLLGSLGIAQ